MNQKSFKTLLAIFSFCVILTSCTNTTKNNWPQFRGPGYNMTLSNENLPTEWGDSLNIRWKEPMEGNSWSSPIICGDKIFYSSSVLVEKAPIEIDTTITVETNNDSAPPQNQDNQLKDIIRLQLTCLDLKTGKELWKAISYEGNPKIKKHIGSTYACETPVTDGNYIYVYYSMHGVYCYDLKGNLIWNKNLGTYKTLNDWGTGASPTLHNNTLFIQVDNEEHSFIVALDSKNGEEKWKKNRDEKTTYNTPVIWQNNVRTELVSLGSTARSYDPASGELLWDVKNIKGTSIPSAVFNKEYIYIGNAGGPGKPGNLYAVKAGANGNITPAVDQTTSEGIIWSDSIAGTGNPSPVLHNGLIYLLASQGGELRCLDAKTGELIYKEDIKKVTACWATPWINNNLLYFYDEKGRTQVIKTGKEFELVGTYSIKDKFWASIAATEDAYIFKGTDWIYCVGK